MRNSALCEINEKFGTELERMDGQAWWKSQVIDKASKVYKCLATADEEVRNFWKIRFSPVKLWLSYG
jgi:hypothetical protein